MTEKSKTQTFKPNPKVELLVQNISIGNTLTKHHPINSNISWIIHPGTTWHLCAGHNAFYCLKQ